MIVTVTPNPSIDRTLHIPRLPRGEVTRVTELTAEAGGKGVNVARDLALHGLEAIAVTPLSSASAIEFAGLLAGAATLEVVPVDGPVRINVSLVEPDGTVTKVNEPGPVLTESEVESLLDHVALLARKADWVAGCGSLPRGVPGELYARLAERVGRGVSVVVDADGPALRAAAHAGVAMLKPNRSELEGLVERALPTLGDVMEAAHDVLGWGIGALLVSLGADGALYVDRGTARHAEAHIDDLQNTVGAGDALLAGFLAGGGTSADLRTAVAWSVAACRSPGTSMRAVQQRDLDAVEVHDIVRPGRLLAA